MPERDPRVDPKEGDVLRCGECEMKVTLVGRKVHFEEDGSCHTATKTQWRIYCGMLNPEVVHAAE